MAKPPQAAPPPPPQQSRNKQKKDRKKRNAAAAAAATAASSGSGQGAEGGAVDQADNDEMAMLEANASANSVLQRQEALRSCWQVDAANLDADAEMRRRFGARAVRVAQREAAAEERQQIRGHGRGGGGRAPPTPRRVLFVTPQAEWGRPHGLLRMRGSPGSVEAGTTIYEFEWSEDYVRQHQQYEALVAMSADPQMLLELLRHEPCHVGALAQLHEVASHTGQAERANEYLQRLLWAHEAAYTPGFKEALLRGEARLRSGDLANRYYLRALHKSVVALGRRGCHKAALSAGTLLLSMDRTDWTKLRLWYDLLVLRAEAPHLLWLQHLNDPDTWRRLPGAAFSYALALKDMSVTDLPVPAAAAAALKPANPEAGTGADGAAPPPGLEMGRSISYAQPC